MTEQAVYLGIGELRPTVELVTCHFFRRDIWFHYRVPRHHLILVETGRIDAVTPDERFTAGAGDLVCFRPADWNQYGTRGETRYFEAHVQFSPAPRHQLTPFLDGVGPLPLCLPLKAAVGEARSLFQKLCLEVRSAEVSAVLKTRSVIFDLLALVARVMGPNRELTPMLDYWQRVEQRLMEGMHSELRVSELAARLGLSAEHFIRQFKRRFGQSPKAYHTQARLREAARLLSAGEMSVKSVAYALGYSEPKAFGRSFKAHFGLCPAALRRTGIPGMPVAATRPASLYPINRHILPPTAHADWFKEYLPKGRAPVLDEEREEILAKISHPEDLPHVHG